MPFSVKTQVKVSTTGKLRKRLNVTMKHATHAATKTMPTSSANSSQTRQRFSRSMSNNVQRVPALVFTAKGSPSSHSLTLRGPVASPKKVLLRCFVASEERYSWSAGGRHLLSSCLHLQRAHPCELLLVVGEAPAQRRRVEREVLVFEARRGGLIERLQGQQPLVRREGLIVALVDLGASALLGEQFYRGQEEVHVL